MGPHRAARPGVLRDSEGFVGLTPSLGLKNVSAGSGVGTRGSGQGQVMVGWEGSRTESSLGGGIGGVQSPPPRKAGRAHTCSKPTGTAETQLKKQNPAAERGRAPLQAASPSAGWGQGTWCCRGRAGQGGWGRDDGESGAPGKWGELPLKFVAPPKGAGRPGAPRGASLVGLSDTEPSQKSAPSCPPVAALQTRGDTDPTRLESSLCNQANQSKRLAIRHGRTPSFPRRAAGLSGSAPAPPERPAGSTLSVPASA